MSALRTAKVQGLAGVDALQLGDSAAGSLNMVQGAILRPNVPLFLATKTAAAADQTGDGTAYTVVCETEVLDQSGAHNIATGVFTAPVTGRYILGGMVQLMQLAAGHTDGSVQIITSNRNYVLAAGNLGAMRGSGNDIYVGGMVLADMDAADTAYLLAAVSNSTKTVDINGSGSTKFYGALLG